jgi:succinate-semialdehyde dehydrogenase/glutarate-semialdehyde dehydrogenase
MQYEKLAMYIDGTFIYESDREKIQDVINPANLQVIGKLPHATKNDLDMALQAADRAFQSWRHVSPMEKSRILRRVAELTRERAEEIARNITLDMGKPLAESRLEVKTCAEHAEWHAEECRRIYGRVIPARLPNVRQMTVREPVGVCVAFTPWNFPFNQAIRKMVAAIGAGCTLVLKGPEDAPSAVVALARIFHDAGLPPGCLNIVWGVPSEISEYLIASPIVRKVSFTGSVPVGKQLAALAGAHMKRVTMELGGHSPVLVFEDADVEQAAKLVSAMKMRNAGQLCIAPSRFFIHEKVYDKFLSTFTDAVSKLKVGDGMFPDIQMGPLVHEKRVHMMQSLVDDALERGAKVHLGGKVVDESGYFFPPTVLTDIPEDARMMVEEPFGPVAPIVRFKDTDEVIRRANSLPFGLAAYAFTGSLKTSRQVSSGLETGMVNINHFGITLSETPFGGVKDSGIGSEGGQETFDGYLVTKFITEAS